MGRRVSMPSVNVPGIQPPIVRVTDSTQDAMAPTSRSKGSVARAASQLLIHYSELRPQVAKIAGALIGQRPPSDLVHDICVDVTLSRARFRYACAFSTWMYSIVSHHVHNWIRKERQHRNVIRAAEQASWSLRVIRPDEVLQTVVAVDQLRNGFALLTETQRTCLVMVRCECLSAREVATLLNITPTAVRMHVHRARLRLRRYLDERR